MQIFNLVMPSTFYWWEVCSLLVLLPSICYLPDQQLKGDDHSDIDSGTFEGFSVLRLATASYTDNTSTVNVDSLVSQTL